MEYTALQIANLLSGKVFGNPEVKVNSLSKIEEGKANTVSFLANMIYAKYLYTTSASIVLVSDDFMIEGKTPPPCTLILVKNPRENFAILLEKFNQIKKVSNGISTKAYISNTAKIGNNVSIEPFVYVGENARIAQNVHLYPNTYIGENVEIGNDTIIYTGVKIYHNCIIGSNVIIHAGAVIGSDGFGFQVNHENKLIKIPHIGNVIIEDDVEIGANTTIDRATLGATIIRKGVKLDNLIQIGHNVEIGENTVIAAQTGIAGSTKIGKNCMIGGQAGIVGHLSIADGVKIAAQSGVTKGVKESGASIQGTPAFNSMDFKRSFSVFKNLPNLQNQLNELENKMILQEVY
jgi:UDP-3-O-[3-hydroxymyristoyl] glucosamine N-acyltransferase